MVTRTEVDASECLCSDTEDTIKNAVLYSCLNIHCKYPSLASATPIDSYICIWKRSYTTCIVVKSSDALGKIQTRTQDVFSRRIQYSACIYSVIWVINKDESTWSNRCKHTLRSFIPVSVPTEMYGSSLTRK